MRKLRRSFEKASRFHSKSTHRQTNLALESLEKRLLLSLDLPGMHLVDPQADYFDGQIVYLDFDGEQDVNYDGPVTIDGIDVPAFRAPGILSGQEQEIIDHVLQQLVKTFEGSGLVFTTERPAVGTECSTIYIGGDNHAFSPYGNFQGIAETIDIGNQIQNDNAFVFSDYVPLDELAETAAHEIGHLLGYAHADDDTPGDNISDYVQDYKQSLMSNENNPTYGSYSSSITIDKGSTHRFIVDGVFGTSESCYYEWYSSNSGTSGLLGSGYSDSPDWTDPTISRTFNSTGSYVIRAELWDKTWTGIGEWWEAHRWYVTVVEPNRAPYKASGPSPSDGATNRSVSTDLDWNSASDPDGDSVSYLVYFGTDSSPDSGEYKTTRDSSSYPLPTLAYNTHYYWQIDTTDGALTTTGDVWDFWTLEPDPTASRYSPTNSSVTLAYNTNYTFKANGHDDGGDLDFADWYLTGPETDSNHDYWTHTTDIISSYSHTFDAAGDYGLSCVFSDESGDKATASWSIHVNPKPVPDLVVSDIAMADTTVYPGQSVNLDFWGNNITSGTTSVTNVQMKAYWGTSQNSKSNLIGTEYFGELNGLDYNENEKTTIFGWTVPSLSPGAYWITAEIDSDNKQGNATGENDANNLRSESFTVLEVPKPDLVISDIAMADITVYPGQSVNLDFWGNNITSGTTSVTNVQMKAYWGTSQNSKSNLIGTEYFGELNGLGYNENEKTTIFGWTVPSLSPGTYWITAEIDSDNKQGNTTDENDANNLRSESFTVLEVPKPDLAIQKVYGTNTSYLTTDEINAYVDVKNIGAATASNSKVYYYLGTSSNSTYKPIEDGDLGGIWPLNDMSADEPDTDEINGTWAIPDDTPTGTYYIYCHATTSSGDPNDSANYSSSSNNWGKSSSFTITQAKPDLDVIDMEINGESMLSKVVSFKAGDTVKLDAQVKNIGTDESKSKVPYKWWWGYSENDTRYEITDGSGNEVEGIIATVDGFSINEDEWVSEAFGTPIKGTDPDKWTANLSSGIYWLTFGIDYPNENSEVNETNNLISKKFEVKQKVTSISWSKGEVEAGDYVTVSVGGVGLSGTINLEVWESDKILGIGPWEDTGKRISVTMTSSTGGSAQWRADWDEDGGSWFDDPEYVLRYLSDDVNSGELKVTDKKPPLAPTSLQISGSGGTGSSRTFNWTHSKVDDPDNTLGSGFDKFILIIDGDKEYEGNATSTTITELEGGNHTWSVEAFDKRGNPSKAESSFVIPQVTEVKWGIEKAEAGDKVTVYVSGVGLSGSISLKLYEDDDDGSPTYTETEISVPVSGTSGSTQWQADWTQDTGNFLGDIHPEYTLYYSADDKWSKELKVEDSKSMNPATVLTVQKSGTSWNFDWSDAKDQNDPCGSGLDHYQLIVSNDPEFEVNFWDKLLTDATLKKYDTGTTSQITVSNLPNDYYYWKVLAYDKAGNPASASAKGPEFGSTITKLWWEDESGNIDNIASPLAVGQPMWLKAKTKGLTGQALTIQVYEYDGIGDDLISLPTPLTMEIDSNGNGVTEWIVPWCADGWLGLLGNPEYYFKIDGYNTQSLTLDVGDAIASNFFFVAPWQIEEGKDLPIVLGWHKSIFDVTDPNLDFVNVYIGGQRIDLYSATGAKLGIDKSYDFSGTNGETYYDIPSDPFWYTLGYAKSNDISQNLKNNIATIKVDFLLQLDQYTLNVFANHDTHYTTKVVADIPDWENEGWYQGDTHFHSDLTNSMALDTWNVFKHNPELDIISGPGLLLGEISGEYGAPLAITSIIAEAIGLDWVTVTDHSYELDGSNDNIFGPEPDIYRNLSTSNNYRLAAEEYSWQDFENNPVLDEFMFLKGVEFSVGSLHSTDKWLETGSLGLIETAQQHMLAYNFGDDEEVILAPGFTSVSNNPSMRNISQIMSDIHEADGNYDLPVFTYAAHPMLSDNIFAEPWWNSDINTARNYCDTINSEPILRGFQFWNGRYDSGRDGSLDLWEQYLVSNLNCNHNWYLSGGSDDHLFKYLTNETYIGDVQTVVWAGINPDQGDIFESFYDGTTIVTDGPLFAMGADPTATNLDNYGSIDTQMGEELQLSSADQGRLIFDWPDNNGQWTGKISNKNIKIFHYYNGVDLEDENFKNGIPLDSSNVFDAYRNWLTSSNKVSGWHAYRAELWEDHNKNGIDDTGDYHAYSNPIWMNFDAVPDPSPVVEDVATTIQEGDTANGTLSASKGFGAKDFKPVNGPSYGKLTLNKDGSYSYMPDDLNFNGTDSFTYQAIDLMEPYLKSNIGIVTINITPVNDAPAAFGQDATLAEDTSITITLAGQDIETPAGDLLYVNTGNPQHGEIQINGNTVIYTPTLNYFGQDSFSFIVIDNGDPEGSHSNPGNMDSSPATINITITPVPDAPEIPTQNTITTQIMEDESYSSYVSTTDADGDSLKYFAYQPQHGTLAMNLNGSFTYTPNENYFGDDSFTYWANDGVLNSEYGTIAIQINSINDNPVSLNMSIDADETGEPAVIELAATDIESPNQLTATIITRPTKGTLTPIDGKRYQYVVDNNQNGSDSFKYKVMDFDGGVSSEATVNITIKPVNQKPIAQAQSVEVHEDGELEIVLSATDSESRSSELIYNVLFAQHGTLARLDNNRYLYRPEKDYYGTDTFSFNATDNGDPAGSGNDIKTSEWASIQIIIHPQPDAPVANESRVIIKEEGNYQGNVEGHDADNDTLTYSITEEPENGTISMQEDGAYKYIPNDGFYGVDQFKYKAHDNNQDSEDALVEIIVGYPIYIGSNTSCVYYDKDGSRVSIRLMGTQATAWFAGNNVAFSSDSSVVVTGTGLELVRLELTGGGKGPMVMISASGGDGKAQLGDIAGESIGMFMGRDAELVGDMTLTGSLGMMMFGNILDGASITTAVPGSTMIMAGDIGDATLDIAGKVSMMMVNSFNDGSLVADEIGMVMPKTGVFGANLTARTGKIGMVMASGNITGNFNAATEIGMVMARGADITGLWRAGQKIGMVMADSLNGAQLYSGGDIGTVMLGKDMVDTHLLAGYDIGNDLVFGAGDQIRSGNIGMMMVSGTFGSSYVGAGVLPVSSLTNFLPDAGQAGDNVTGKIGMVRFGQIDTEAAQPFGLYAATAINGKLQSQDDFEICILK